MGWTTRWCSYASKQPSMHRGDSTRVQLHVETCVMPSAAAVLTQLGAAVLEGSAHMVHPWACLVAVVHLPTEAEVGLSHAGRAGRAFALPGKKLAAG